MNIRLASPDDMSCIGRIIVDARRVYLRGLVPDSYLESLNYDRHPEELRQWLFDPDAESYVIEEEGRILGFASIGTCPSSGPSYDAHANGALRGIFLASDSWRKGIGTILYRHVERRLKKRGCTHVFLGVAARNAGARRFYEAMGFKPEAPATMINLAENVPIEYITYEKMLA